MYLAGSMIDLDPAAMTELAVIRQTKEFGYDPGVNNPKNFTELYDDLCGNANFCEWLMSRTQSDEVFAAARIMGESTPVWGRRFHILLSVILTDQWDKV
jgi:hypothetical protein